MRAREFISGRVNVYEVGSMTPISGIGSNPGTQSGVPSAMPFPQTQDGTMPKTGNNPSTATTTATNTATAQTLAIAGQLGIDPQSTNAMADWVKKSAGGSFVPLSQKLKDLSGKLWPKMTNPQYQDYFKRFQSLIGIMKKNMLQQPQTSTTTNKPPQPTTPPSASNTQASIPKS